MRFEAEYAPLMSALTFANAAVRKGYIPIIGCLHIVAKDARVEIAGTDLDSRAVAKCEAAVQAQGEASVEAARLVGFLSAVKGETVLVSMNDGDLRIRCGGASARFATNPDPFPVFGAPDGEVEIPDGIDALRFSAPFAKDGRRHNMEGVAFSRGFAIGADGPQIATRKTGATPDGSVMVPLAAIPLAAKCGGRLFLSERTWRAEADGRAMERLMDGCPPEQMPAALSAMMGV